MGLNAVALGWGVHSTWTASNALSSIFRLQNHLNHPTLTQENRSQLLDTFNKSIFETSVSTLTADLLCLMSEGLNKKEIIDKELISFWCLVWDYETEARKLSNMLTRIALNLAVDPVKQLSWFCVSRSYLETFSTKKNKNHYFELANAMGALLVDLKREAILIEHLPSDLVGIVEKYADENVKLQGLDQVQRLGV
jgi:hypothetical protein